MGKKYLGKTMLLIALSTTLLGASLPAQAAEILPNELVMVQPREIGIVKMNCQLTISSNGNASCLGDVSMKAGYDSEITLALQKSTNGRTWSNVASWTGTGGDDPTGQQAEGDAENWQDGAGQILGQIRPLRAAGVRGVWDPLQAGDLGQERKKADRLAVHLPTGIWNEILP